MKDLLDLVFLIMFFFTIMLVTYSFATWAVHSFLMFRVITLASMGVALCVFFALDRSDK